MSYFCGVITFVEGFEEYVSSITIALGSLKGLLFFTFLLNLILLMPIELY